MSADDPIEVGEELSAAEENQIINEVGVPAIWPYPRTDGCRSTRSGRRSELSPAGEWMSSTDGSTPFLYDTVITHALTWPSLTCQWLPDVET